ncbi:unnamed protein product, partial [Mesorhabditis belari]|uniref:Uncharacterized protein n=1 Tax=Mesorhabditis belari TaxID=2138241 RepID=A0AAF3F3C5_9BILA
MTTVVFGAFELKNAFEECERIRKFPISRRKLLSKSTIVNQHQKSSTTMDEDVQEIDYGAQEKPSSDLIVEIPKNEEIKSSTATADDFVSQRDDEFPQVVDVERFDRKSTDREDPLIDQPTPTETPSAEEVPKLSDDTMPLSNPEPLPQTHMSVDSENGDYEKLNADEADEEREAPRIEKTNPIVDISPETTKIESATVDNEKEATLKESCEKNDKCGCPFSENRHLVFAVGAGLALLALVLAARRCHTSAKCH